jgi:hypothetical protein
LGPQNLYASAYFVDSTLIQKAGAAIKQRLLTACSMIEYFYAIDRGMPVMTKLRVWAVLCSLGLVFSGAEASTLRIACDASASGGEVSINGKFKGECPLDVQVSAGIIQIRVKKLIAGKPEMFEQSVRLGDDVVKRIDVNFGGSPDSGVDGPSRGAVPAVDRKALAQQRYELELTQYTNSIDACLPKFDTEVRRRRATAQQAHQRVYSACRSELAANADGDENYFRVGCGSRSLDWAMPSTRLEDTPEWKSWSAIDGVPARTWCETQFTKPTPPSN